MAAAAARHRAARSDSVDRQGRRFLDHLLMAALDRALALDERQHRAVLVGEHLHLDVPRPHQPALEIDRGVAKRGSGLGTRRAHRARQLVAAVDDTHALAAAARHRLDHQRIADPSAAPAIVGVGHVGRERLFGAGHDGHARAHRHARAPRSCCPSAQSPPPSGR